HALPERVIAVAIASGSGPLDRPGAMHGMSSMDRLICRLSRATPPVARALLAAAASPARRSPERALRSFEKELTPTDHAALARAASAEEAMAFFVEAFRRGAAGAVQDYRLVCGPWGFRLEEIAVPVRLWHGDDDRIVPLHQAEDVAARVPGAELVV